MVVASFHLGRFPAALPATARVPLHRLALRRQPGLRFGRLLGTGRGRTMTASADLRRWAVFATWDDEGAARRFLEGGLPRWWGSAEERFDVLLRPIGAHGSWAGTDPIAGPTAGAARAAPSGTSPTGGAPTAGAAGAGPVAVLTRATVHLRALPAFLRAVPPVDAHLHGVDGLLATVGIGELPIVRQATFSLWRDADAVRRFAYRSPEHAEVIRRTRDERWYGEEWFARFTPIEWRGTWDGTSPLDR